MIPGSITPLVAYKGDFYMFLTIDIDRTYKLMNHFLAICFYWVIEVFLGVGLC
jgi:hypothetical protein